MFLKQSYKSNGNSLTHSLTHSLSLLCRYIPEPAVVVEHLTRPGVLTRVTETGVDLVLTLVAMVTRCALASVLLEADQVTGAAVLARISEAHVTLGQDLRVATLCNQNRRYTCSVCIFLVYHNY